MLFDICTEPCDGSAELVSYYGSVITSTGSPVSGIVRVCYQSSQYLVCDYGWDFAAAKVACRSAGLSPYGMCIQYVNGYWSVPYLFNCVPAGAVRLLNQYSFYFFFFPTISISHCQGNESTLTDCSVSLFSSCYFYDYAGAYCQGILLSTGYQMC